MTPTVTNWLDLRLCVLCAGTRDEASWWKLAMFTETAPKSLRMVFPRTTATAMLTAATEIARQVHETGIGKGRVFHLFRLPSDLEFRLSRAARSLEVAPVLSRMESKNALESLTRLAQGAEATAAPGARLAGSVEDLISGHALPKLAAHYADAFRRGEKSFPYFQ